MVCKMATAFLCAKETARGEFSQARTLLILRSAIACPPDEVCL